MSRRTRLFQIAICLIWMGIHLYLAAERSIGVDEGAKHAYVYLPFLKALSMHMSEIAPYHPGEFAFGYFARILFSGIFPEEIWMRLVAIGFGALTLFLISAEGLSILTVAFFFSAAVTSFATEFLSYTPLIFGGAIAFELLRDRKLNRFWFTINLCFGHLYGLCAVSLASAYRKKWMQAGLNALVVAIVLFIHHQIARAHPAGERNLPSAFELGRQVLGVLSNPHRASLFYGPIFVLGFLLVAGQNVRRAFEILSLIFALTVLPIAASWFGAYPFLPRQALGALVPFLGVVSIVASIRQIKILALLSAILVSGWTWSLYLRGVPPFIDQPLIKVHRVTEKLAEDQRIQQVAWLDPLSGEAAVGYLSRQLRQAPTFEQYSAAGLKIDRNCWPIEQRQLCINAVRDEFVVWQAQEESTQEKLRAFIASRPFDQIVHSYFEIPANIAQGKPTFRIW